MDSMSNGSGLVPVSDEIRWHAIEQRYLRLGITSQRDLERAAEAVEMGISRAAIMKAAQGKASPGTYTRIEAALDEIEHRMTTEAEDLAEAAVKESGMVTFDLRGVFGADSVTVKGPVANLAELEAAVEKLLRGPRDQD